MAYLRIDDIAHAYNVSLRTARRWAAQDGWRSTTTRPRRYDLEDADASYRKRHTRHMEQILAQALDKMAP